MSWWIRRWAEAMSRSEGVEEYIHVNGKECMKTKIIAGEEKK